MNEDIKNRIDALTAQVQELKRRLDKKDTQQLTYTLDPISESVLEQSNFLKLNGTGTFGTQVVNVTGGGGGSVTVPAQPSGTIKINLGNKTYELLIK